MIKAVSFDFDGTLVRSNAIKRKAYYEATKTLGHRGALGRVLSSTPGDRRAVLRNFIEELAGKGIVPGRRKKECVESLVRAYTRICVSRISACPEVAGASKALAALRRSGKKLFLNSATPLAGLLPILEKRKWRGHFDGIYGAHGKKAAYLRKIMAKCAIGTAELLHVGDGEDDRLAAEEVDCHFLAVKRRRPPFAVPPEREVANLASLAREIGNMEQES
jgi:phosphoglycolate phosphatase-like HAD superfamily hydrolase